MKDEEGLEEERLRTDILGNEDKKRIKPALNVALRITKRQTNRK